MEMEAKTKTIAECQLTGSGIHDETNQDGNGNSLIQASGIPDLTNSQDTQIAKVNGPGAPEEGKEALAVSDGGDDFDVPLTELSRRRNLGDPNTGGNSDGSAVARNSCEMGNLASSLGKINESRGDENGELDGEADDDATGAGESHQITTETMASVNNFYSEGSVQKVDYNDGDGEVILSSLNGNLEKNLKPAGGSKKRGRKPKTEAKGGRSMDGSLPVNENQVDSGGKLADMHHSSISRRTTRNMAAAVSSDKVEGINNSLKDGKDVSGDDADIRFSVGDFVWGKIKGHPWWPGRIYDPRNASDYALTIKHEGRFLVAYFGDATFAWCTHSQLKPFVENFCDMSKQSSTKGFIHAVDEAVNEFSSLVELKMTVGRHEDDREDDRPLIVNAGIKGEVRVPDGGIGNDSLIVEFKPDVFLSQLRDISKSFSAPNMLELSVLKSHVSAFFQTERGYTLLQYNEPQEIGDGGPRIGPTEDDDDDFVSQSVKEDAVADSDEDRPVISVKSTPKRKEKSIAELLGTDKSKVENEEEDAPSSERGKKLGKLGSKPRRTNKRNPGDEGLKVAHYGDSTPVATGSKTRKGRKTRYPPADVTGDDVVGNHDEEQEKRVTRSSSRGTRKRNNEEVVHPAVEEEPKQKKSSRLHSRERKKSRYLSPPFITPKQRQRGLEGTPIVKCRIKPAKEAVITNLDLVSTPKVLGPSPNYVLSEIRSFARNPRQVIEESKSLDGVKTFLSSYRISKYGAGGRTGKSSTEDAEHVSGVAAEAAPTGRPSSRKRKSKPMHISQMPSEGDQRAAPKSENVKKRRRGRRKKLDKLNSEAAAAEREAEEEKQHHSSTVAVVEAETGRQPAPVGSDGAGADADGFGFVKKKLNELTSMLADQAELTDEMKLTVHYEIEEMLKRVNSGRGSSSS